MKRKVEYHEYFCDRCQRKVKRLYGRDDGHFLVTLANIAQSECEECKITPQYYLHQNGGREVINGGVCLECLKEILHCALSHINRIERE